MTGARRTVIPDEHERLRNLHRGNSVGNPQSAIVNLSVIAVVIGSANGPT
jgi:hypothetical protein